MAKKKKIQETTIENYYDLKVDKVDELVAALKGDDTEEFEELSMNISDCTGVDDPKNVTRRGKQKQFDPYRNDFFGRIPVWLKAIFIKFWFAGAVCWFIMFGLGVSDLDGIVLTGAVLGIVVDVLVNPAFKFMETDKKEFDKYIMFPFPFKAFWTFFVNILYYIVVLFAVNFVYLGVETLLNIINGTESLYYLPVEPLMFGLFTVIVDMIFIGIKDAIVYAVKHTRKKENVLNV